MIEYLILGTTYAFAAAVQPGPFMTYLVSQTLSNGWRRTVPATFAPLISDAPIIALVLFVLSRVPTWFAQILQFSGGIFLIYLALGAFRSYKNYNMGESLQTQSNRQTVLKAAIVNLLNPNPYLAWSLVMGPLLLKGWSETPTNGIALIAGFYVTLIFVTLGIMLLFGAARNLGPRVSRILVGISSMAMAGFGLYEIYSVISIIK
jgi:threonine/homoserine/homoserine lactone efflux protein